MAHRRSEPLLIALTICFLSVSGCAIQYYDASTGTEHLWGIGHMRMKVSPPADGVRAVVTASDTLGIVAGSVATERRISIGWERFTLLQVIAAESALSLEWPGADLFSMRVGGDVPPQLNKQDDDREQQNKETK